MKDILDYGTPEEVGIKSEWIEEEILDYVEFRRFISHSVLIARHGKVVAEGYYAPYKQNDFHRMYSTSKTFTSTAIGMLIGEGKLALEDKIVKFFPDKVKEPVDPWIADMTIRDLLIMSTPFARPTYNFDRKDWVDSFFYTKPTHPAGTYFSYDTSGTFILDVIVEKITGKTFLDYLYDVILHEAGCSEGMRCVKSPDGYAWGGSGVQCTTRDIARLGQIYLNHGMVNGRQILPRWYADAASSHQVDNSPKGQNDFYNGWGYGYQIWCGPDNTFTFLGMGGQIVYCDPKTELMMATTGDMQGCESDIHGIGEMFFALRRRVLREGKETFAPNQTSYEHLKNRLASLKMSYPIIGSDIGEMEDSVYGKTYVLDENPMGIERFRFEKAEDGKSGKFIFFARGEEKVIDYGIGDYKLSVFPETNFDGLAIGEPMGRGYRSIARASWTERQKFVLRVFLIDDYFGNMTATFSFRPGTVTLYMTKAAEHFLGNYTGLANGREA